MNTDVRRSIFVAIMSATDYKDAQNRISKLRLKRSQELEIPRVLIHCASAEESYNPFYSLIARRVCSDRKIKMAFQFSLWNLFKRMGEDREDEKEGPDDEDEDELQLRSLVNLAKFFGVLVAEDGLGIGVLKVTLPFSMPYQSYQILNNLHYRYSISPTCNPKPAHSSNSYSSPSFFIPKQERLLRMKSV